jgi:hypothetical protein
MQAPIYSIATVVFWALTIFRLGTVRRQGTQDNRVWTLWLFFLCFSLTLTLHLPGVYVAVDVIAGVNNLSWLLSYLCVVLAVYFLSVSTSIAMKVKRPRWMTPYLMVTVGLLVLIFPFGIAITPENPDHNVPGSAPELLFEGLLYVYGAIMFATPAWIFRQTHRNERALPIRLRIYVTQATAILGTVLLMLRLIIVALIGFSLTSSLLISQLIALSDFILAGAGLLCFLSIAPSKLYSTLAHPLLFCKKMVALPSLARLQTRLSRLCPQTPPHQGQRWQIRDLDLHLYRTVIAILDGRKALAAHRTTKEATRLYNRLQNIPDDLDFDGLATILAQIGRTP